MKKIIISSVLIYSAIVSFGQEKLNKISTNPIQLFGVNILNIEYERGFSDGKVGVSFYMGRSGVNGSEIGDYILNISQQKFLVKRYSKSLSEKSFWFGGQLSQASGRIIGVKSAAGDGVVALGTIGITGKLGYQFVLGSFYTDFHGGLGYALTNNLYGQSQYSGDVSESKILVDIGINMGIIF